MARIAFAVAGAVTGAIIGGPAGAIVGLSLGSIVGSIVDPVKTYGPRLNDLAVSSGANGTVIPFGYGTFRVGGQIIWCPGIVENQQTRSAKGAGNVSYNYYASLAAAFGQGPAQIVRVWADSKVIYDAGGPSYFPSNYFPSGEPSYQGGICCAFTDSLGNLIQADWVGHGTTLTVPSGATCLQLGINNNYQCITAGGFPVNVSVAGGESLSSYVPATAVPWEVIGSENSSYPFGNVGGTAPVLVLQNLSAGQSVTIAAIPNSAANNNNYNQNAGNDQGRICLNTDVGATAEGWATGNNPQWYGPDGNTNIPTGSAQTGPPTSIYPGPNNCYAGTETQNPDPLIQANEGIAGTPAFRGLCYAVWENLPLANFGNRLPVIRAELAFGQVGAYFPVIVQQAALRTNTATVTLTLPFAPAPGNKLLFLIGGNGGGVQSQGVVPQFTLDANSPTNEAGGGYNICCWAFWRTVQVGDGQSWVFDIGNTNGMLNFMVFELSGVQSISTALSGAFGSGYGACTWDLSNIPTGFSTVLGVLAYSYPTNFSGSFTPTEYAVIETESDSGNDCAAFFCGQGEGLSGTISTTLQHVNSNECHGIIAIVLESASINTTQTLTNTLDQVVEDICLRSGLSAPQIDVSRLVSQQVIGYVVGRFTTGQQALQPLAAAYFFDGAEIEGVLVFIPRGQSSLMTIPESDLGLYEDNAEFTEEMGQEQDLPRDIQVVYADPAIDYQQNKQAKRRSAKIVKTRQQSILELPFALEADTAAQVAERALYVTYLERRKFSVNLWKALYSILTPTDVITIIGQGVAQQLRIVKTSEGASRAVRLSAVSEMPNVYISKRTGGIVQSFSGSSGSPLLNGSLYLLDIPLLRDKDANASGTGFYAGVGAGSGWQGAVLYSSTDNATWETEGSIATALNYGQAINTLGDIGNGSPAGTFSPWALDTANTLHFSLNSGSLASATEAQLIAQGVNALLVGSEIIQFETATQNTDGSWTVSNLLRGRRGTDGACGSHAASETVIVLNSALTRNSESNAALGQTRYYRAVSAGQTLDGISSQEFTISGEDLKPYSPVGIGGAFDSSNDMVISWFRRTRLGGSYGSGAYALTDGMNGPLSEQTEAYQIDILNSGGTVVRTIQATTASAVYTAGQQTTDFGSVQSSYQIRVYQMSAAIGRGFGGAATVPASTTAPVTLPGGGQFYIN
jgi:hypothetical protein